MTFPPDFLWGTASSATQVEGAAVHSDWWDWEQGGHAPRSGGGNGFAQRFAADFALLAAHGLRHHRLSLDWARLAPTPDGYDAAEIARYRVILSAARAAGVAPWVCLLHGALPRWFAADGGFLGPEATSRWARHVDVVGEAFGDLVYGWKPVNGPTSFATRRYLTGQFPPGVRDRETFAAALAAVHRADVAAAKRLRAGGRPTASVHPLVPLYPGPDPGSAAALAALDRAVWESWLPLARAGAYADAFDFIGFSYYFGAQVDAAGRLGPHPADGVPGPQGYVAWPDGLRVVLDRLAAELPGRRLLVSELGYGGSDDTRRVAYLRRALAHVREAIADGVDVAGVFLWTGIDNYEWTDGYRVPFGLFDRDRRPRPSAHVVRELILGGGLPAGTGERPVDPLQ